MSSCDAILQTTYLISFEGKTVLECGSHQEGGETRLFREKNECYYIEALKQDLDVLRTQPNIKVENTFNYALTNYDGITSFTVTDLAGNSSIQHLEGHIEELEQKNFSYATKITVPCISYKTFIRDIIKKPIDIFILDIEGGECAVLENMKELRVDELPKIIAIEAGYDWPKRKELLKQLGYTIDYYCFNNVVLSHPHFNIPKNMDQIRYINQQFPNFIWCGKLIFENDCL
jgi:FkbM family methyltransferase